MSMILGSPPRAMWACLPMILSMLYPVGGRDKDSLDSVCTAWREESIDWASGWGGRARAEGRGHRLSWGEDRNRIDRKGRVGSRDNRDRVHWVGTGLSVNDSWDRVGWVERDR